MSSFWLFLADVPGGFAALAPAALGGLLTEQTGFLNIALEGLIMAGAFVYIAVGSVWGPWAGIFAALALCAILALANDWLCQRLGTDSFVAGLGLNLLIPGLVSIVSHQLFATKGIVAVAALQSRRLFEALPGRQTEYLALLAVGLVVLFVKFTSFGLRTKALGLSPDAVRMAGINPHAVRRNAYALSGLLAGLSGVALAASVGAWVPGISAGRGWIALVAVFLGGRRLRGTLLASLGFTVLLAIASRAQVFALLSAEVLTAIPYLITTLVVISGAAYRRRLGRKINGIPPR